MLITHTFSVVLVDGFHGSYVGTTSQVDKIIAYECKALVVKI